MNNRNLFGSKYGRSTLPKPGSHQLTRCYVLLDPFIQEISISVANVVNSQNESMAPSLHFLLNM
jgi:hypothetical protein